MKISRFKLALILFLVAAAAGCEETQAPPARPQIVVPQSAKVVAEGAGQLKYRVTEDGRLFIFDVDDQAVDAMRHVRAGQQFVLNPEANTATLDGRKALEQDLKKTHSHRLYFEPE